MSDDERGLARRYDREDAEAILAHASALSVSEIEEAAEEAGIDRKYVHRALVEIDRAPTPMRNGMRTRIVRRRLFRRRIEGDELDALLTRADAVFGAVGRKDIRGKSASWAARHIHITVESHPQGSMVQISERFVNTVRARVTMAYGLGFAMAAGVSGALMAFLGFWGLLPTLLFGGAVSWAVIYGYRIAHERYLEQLGDTFERALASLEQAALGPSADF